MDFKAAIFDMDGTLVDSLRVWEIIWKELGVHFKNNADFHPSAEDDRLIRTMLLKDGAEMLHRNYSLGEDGEQVHKVIIDVISRFYREQVELKDGVEEFLESLKNKGIPMCIASATALDLIELAVEKCSLNRYFKRVVSCSEVGKGKEEPDD